MKSRIHVFVSGRVQGVFFRYETRKTAKDLGIKGWVRNLPDGRVEVIAEVDKDKIDNLIEFLKKGTPAARIDKVDVETEEYQNEFEDFTIKY